jgi:hypothetical protein
MRYLIFIVTLLPAILCAEQANTMPITRVITQEHKVSIIRANG